MAMMYYYVVSNGGVEPTGSGLGSCEQTIADVLKENEGEAGIAYIGHDTIGGVVSFYVQWAKTGSSEDPPVKAGGSFVVYIFLKTYSRVY